MHDTFKTDLLPDDAFIVWWSGSWLFLFSQSEKRLYIESADSRPMPLGLNREDVLYLLDVVENWNDERQQEANRLLEKGAGIAVKLELEIAKAKTRALFKDAKINFYVPGRPGYEQAEKRREGQEKKRDAAIESSGTDGHNAG